MSQKYKNNFLTTTICRVDFSPIPIEQFDAKCGTLIPLITALLPTYTKRKFIEWETKIMDNTKVDESKESSLHEFFDSSKHHKFVLTYNYLSLECSKYVNFESLEQIIQRILKLVLEAFTDIRIQRLGMRYVNQIKIKEGDPLDWTSLVKSSLINNVDNCIDNKSKVSRSLSQMTLNEEDYKITFTYGLYNSEFPNRIARKEFLLDYDCYTDLFERNDIYTLLKVFNAKINDLFEKSIEDGLRTIMEPITGAQL